LKLDAKKVDFAILEKAENDYLRERMALSLKKKKLISNQRKASIYEAMSGQEFNIKDLIEGKFTIDQAREKIGEIIGEPKSNADRDQLTEITKAELELEKAFLANVHAEVIGKVTSVELSKILSHFASSHHCGPLFNLPESRRHVYVLTFNGDVAASQVKDLREEVTAILTQADPERSDCVVVRLNSSGGTVTGYGHAAAQLERLKKAGINVIVCIDEVAASGGYMMAVVAHKIYASPLAALGSIGVIATAPNIQKRLEREGIEFDEITAGQYKRTLTPFKVPNAKDRKKLQDDITAIFELFKMHIQKHRPIVNLRTCATGEVWFGSDALKRNLCDELLTSDDVLMKMHEDGSDIYSIKHTQKKKPGEELFSSAARRALKSLFFAIFSTSDSDIASELETSQSYLVKDLSLRNENHSVHYKYAKNEDD
jgi:serine protease SohB